LCFGVASAGRKSLRRPRSNGRIILKWLLKKQEAKAQTGSIWLRIGTSGRQALVNVVLNLQLPKIFLG
jgi:hypothetical protein